MLNINELKLFFLLLCALRSSALTYNPPKAKVEPIFPKGLRISVPDSSGISLVAFHVKINEDFEGLEAGSIARDIPKARNGRWTYQDRTTSLEVGDIIYYWVHVVYNGLGYNLIDQQHRVSDFYSMDGSKVEVLTPSVGSGNCDKSETKIYDASGDALSTTVCSNSLLFHENFGSDARINQSTWRIIEQFSDAPDYEFVVYRNYPRNVKLKNGKLIIKPTLLEAVHGEEFLRQGTLTLDKCTGRPETTECKREARGSNILPPVNSGRIDTRRSFAFTYGRIVIRAKLPRGDWIYPLLTLEPLPRITDFERDMDFKPESSVQLRVVSSTGNMELRDPNRRDISGHVIWGGAVVQSIGGSAASLANDNRRSTRYSEIPWSYDFHDYELEWRPRHIVVKVDNVQYDFKDIDLPLDKPYYINIGLAVGGLTEFPDMSTSNGNVKPWRNVASKAMFDFNNVSSSWRKTWDDEGSSLQVDFVKVFAL